MIVSYFKMDVLFMTSVPFLSNSSQDTVHVVVKTQLCDFIVIRSRITGITIQKVNLVPCKNFSFLLIVIIGSL